MKTLTAEQKEEITSALRRAGASLSCPRCGHDSFTLLDGYLTDPIQWQLKNIVIGNNHFWCAATTCDRCGYLAQHSLQTLGLPVLSGR